MNYIIEMNSKERIRQRVEILNADNIFYKNYLKRVMHPKYFMKSLQENKELDIDAYEK